MKIQETIKIAIVAIFSNKVRSFLTMLGVIIGVFSVVTLVSLGRGIQNYVTDEFNALGSNLIFVSPGNADIAGDPAQAYTNNKLDQKHVDLIRNQAGEFVNEVTPYIIVGETASYKTKSYYSEVTGVNYQALEVFNFLLKDGRNFTRAEERTKAKVAIIGPIIVKELFGAQNPIGQNITVGDDTYEIIGTFKEKGQNYDDLIIAPYTSVQDSFDITNYSSIVVSVKSADNIALASSSIEVALLRDLKDDEFTLMSQQDILQEIQGILNILTIGLGAIAGISLLVGGIGIMNIMLVSVTERTREIGLRKAVGATPSNIGAQFLTESVVLSVSGGLIGLALGFAATAVARQFVRAEITSGAVLLAFGFSLFVGALFGTYPALQASKKDPIDSLRYE